jgi:hypothetical protein
MFDDQEEEPDSTLPPVRTPGSITKVLEWPLCVWGGGGGMWMCASVNSMFVCVCVCVCVCVME